MIEPLPPELAALLDAERAAPGPDASVQAAVRGQMARSIAGVPLGHAVTGASVKLVTLVVLAVAAGGAGIGAYVVTTATSPPPTLHAHAHALAAADAGVHDSRPDPPPVPQARPTTPVAASVSLAPAAPVMPVPQAAPARPAAPPPMPSRHVAVAVPAEPPPPSPDTLEATLLTQAWQALTAGDAAHALAIVDQDAVARPHGTLEEERRALEVAALDALGRRDEARADARAFLQQFPHSLHGRLVAAVLQPKDPP